MTETLRERLLRLCDTVHLACEAGYPDPEDSAKWIEDAGLADSDVISLIADQAARIAELELRLAKARERVSMDDNRLEKVIADLEYLALRGANNATDRNDAKAAAARARAFMEGRKDD